MPTGPMRACSAPEVRRPRLRAPASGRLPRLSSLGSLLVGLGLIVAWPAHPVLGQKPSAPPLPTGAEKISDNVYRLGAVIVDLKDRSISVPAVVNLKKGVVEYLAVGKGGRRHESILMADVRPLHIQLGLILLGLEPQGGLTVKGDTQVPKGPGVEIWVSWDRGGKEVRVRAEELVWDIKREKPMEADPWVFSGSRITQQGFLADREQSLIATYRDPEAIINNRLPSGADDTVYEANEKVIPRVGTAATLIIKAQAPLLPPPAKPPAPSAPRSG